MGSGETTLVSGGRALTLSDGRTCILLGAAIAFEGDGRALAGGTLSGVSVDSILADAGGWRRGESGLGELISGKNSSCSEEMRCSHCSYGLGVSRVVAESLTLRRAPCCWSGLRRADFPFAFVWPGDDCSEPSSVDVSL
jgi:hypothetical protein